MSYCPICGKPSEGHEISVNGEKILTEIRDSLKNSAQ